jgi:hypothetical protein
MRSASYLSSGFRNHREDAIFIHQVVIFQLLQRHTQLLHGLTAGRKKLVHSFAVIAAHIQLALIVGD